MPKSELSQLSNFLNAHPEIETFEVLLPDFNGNLRGKWILRSKIEKAFKGGLKLPISTLGFDAWGRDPKDCLSNGDADGICVPDINSMTSVPWLDRPTGQVLLSLNQMDGQPSPLDPRFILKSLITGFQKLGLSPMLASEMEFYLFQKEMGQHKRPVHSQTNLFGGEATGGQTYGIDAMQDQSELMHHIREACEAQGLPVDTLITEAAPSQYEINLYHQPDALLAADQALLLKRAIKGVAKGFNLHASFMAKPFADLAGSGMHSHCSLVDDKGNNAFDNGTDQGNEILRHAVAGCLASMPDSMLLFAPNINSYRRFQHDSHAPMAPSWGYENRSVSVRIPADNHQAMRIEHRVAGADANPHLVSAAIVAGMLYGIENKLSAPEPIVGNAYEQCSPGLPRYCPDALNGFKHSDFIREYFGADFQQAFSATKQQELEEFDKHITALEYEAYL